MGHRPENCRDVIAQLSAYVDFELTPPACYEVEEHLADCPACLELLEGFRHAITLLHTYVPSGAPAPLSDQARAQLEDAWHKMLAARRP